jgi:hypothetical protein
MRSEKNNEPLTWGPFAIVGLDGRTISSSLISFCTSFSNKSLQKNITSASVFQSASVAGLDVIKYQHSSKPSCWAAFSIFRNENNFLC